MSDYQRRLMRRGFAILGEGWYGVVLAKPGSPWVIKLGNSLEDGWPHFAALVMRRHATNPFAPHIRSLRWHGLDSGSPFFVAVVERLARTINDVDPRDPRYRLWEASREVLLWGSRDAAREDRAAVASRPELARLMRDIRRLQARTSADADLHGGNAMIRAGDPDSLVITDPLGCSGRYSRPTRRRRYSSTYERSPGGHTDAPQPV